MAKPEWPPVGYGIIQDSLSHRTSRREIPENGREVKRKGHQLDTTS